MKKFYSTDTGFEDMPAWIQQLVAFAAILLIVTILFLPLWLYMKDYATGWELVIMYAVYCLAYGALFFRSAKTPKEPDAYLQRHRQAICTHPIDDLYTDIQGRTWCKACGLEVDMKTKQAVTKPYKTNE